MGRGSLGTTSCKGHGLDLSKQLDTFLGRLWQFRSSFPCGNRRRATRHATASAVLRSTTAGVLSVDCTGSKYGLAHNPRAQTGRTQTEQENCRDGETESGRKVSHTSLLYYKWGDWEANYWKNQKTESFRLFHGRMSCIRQLTKTGKRDFSVFLTPLCDRRQIAHEMNTLPHQ